MNQMTKSDLFSYYYSYVYHTFNTTCKGFHKILCVSPPLLHPPPIPTQPHKKNPLNPCVKSCWLFPRIIYSTQLRIVHHRSRHYLFDGHEIRKSQDSLTAPPLTPSRKCRSGRVAYGHSAERRPGRRGAAPSL